MTDHVTEYAKAVVDGKVLNPRGFYIFTKKGNS